MGHGNHGSRPSDHCGVRFLYAEVIFTIMKIHVNEEMLTPKYQNISTT